jgi:hypothetical protein
VPYGGFIASLKRINFFFRFFHVPSFVSFFFFGPDVCELYVEECRSSEQSPNGPVAERAQRLLSLSLFIYSPVAVCLIDSGWFHLYGSLIFIADIFDCTFAVLCCLDAGFFL